MSFLLLLPLTLRRITDWSHKYHIPMSLPCPVCAGRAYMPESFQFEGLLIHKRCFQCRTCRCTLRLNNAFRRNEQLYCKNHLPSPPSTGTNSPSPARGAASYTRSSTPQPEASPSPVRRPATPTPTPPATPVPGPPLPPRIASSSWLNRGTAAASTSEPSCTTTTTTTTSTSATSRTHTQHQDELAHLRAEVSLLRSQCVSLRAELEQAHAELAVALHESQFKVDRETHRTARPLCIVCEAADVEVALLPCGHYLMCQACANMVLNSNRLCPIDRKPIASTVFIFES